MRLTRAGEYAVRCALYLSFEGEGVLARRKDIARVMDIPDQFLGKIAQQLARARIIEIVQGSKGGYRLRVPPEKLTLLDVVEDIVRSVYGYGFRRILVLNGHGGNIPARGRLYELASQLPGLRLAWYDWWLSDKVGAVAEAHGLQPAHANWLEAFPFTKVAEIPQEYKAPPRVPGLLGAQEAREIYGDGSFGGRYEASAEVMEAIFREALQDIIALLAFE